MDYVRCEKCGHVGTSHQAACERCGYHVLNIFWRAVRRKRMSRRP